MLQVIEASNSAGIAPIDCDCSKYKIVIVFSTVNICASTTVKNITGHCNYLK